MATRAKVVLARIWIVLRTVLILRSCICRRGSFRPFWSKVRRDVMSILAIMLPVVASYITKKGVTS